MKMFLGLAIFIWLLCGVGGAWMMDDLDADNWTKVLRGPITLIKAMNNSSPIYPHQV